jgi:DNA-directed RNA polymerase subunit RPC12/RpoP
MAARSAKKAKKPTFTSRAVIRLIEAGSAAECEYCGERVKFQAKVRAYQVICNVYVDGRWDRVEHYHAECYKQVGEPYGEAAA